VKYLERRIPLDHPASLRRMGDKVLEQVQSTVVLT
jgi:hypothetical protein